MHREKPVGEDMNPLPSTRPARPSSRKAPLLFADKKSCLLCGSAAPCGGGVPGAAGPSPAPPAGVTDEPACVAHSCGCQPSRLRRPALCAQEREHNGGIVVTSPSLDGPSYSSRMLASLVPEHSVLVP